MANLPESEDFAEGTYQIETSDRVIGGPGGIANKQAEQLGNRTAWLRAAIAKIISGTTAVGKAAQWATARTLKFKGAVTGSVSFDGSTDTEVTLTLSDSGVAAGTYTKVTLNTKGLITSGSNPTTLNGYGITDAIQLGQHGLGAVVPPETGSDAIGRPGGFYFFGEGTNSFTAYASVLNLPYGSGNSAQLAIRQGSPKASAAIRSVNAQGGWTLPAELWTDANFNPSTKADRATTLTGYGITDAYTRAQTDSAITSTTNGKADKATTLAGYGITDAYTRGQTDSAITSATNGKADKATTLAGYGITDAYTRGQTDSAITSATSGKADKATTLAGYSITDAYTRGQTDSAITSATNGKADKATTLAGYGISDALTSQQVNAALSKKLDNLGGTIDGSLYVISMQSLAAPALSIETNTPGSSLSLVRLRGPNTGVLLSHINGTSTLSVLTAAGGAATISAGDVLSSGSPCHTVASFMKPVAGQWVSIEGALTLPAGGTWAYQFLNFNNTGSFLGGSRTGLVAGGTQIGAATSVGFAWRIQ
ncbi:hypothetical protein [Pseudomonas lactis]|uniref:hypothetical protein n=1 Tax=Pseudomonas lactis TaxID=1615674 RepID=UPI0021650A54|nr:hypothetical protein [Pseudomonas lactis]